MSPVWEVYHTLEGLIHRVITHFATSRSVTYRQLPVLLHRTFIALYWSPSPSTSSTSASSLITFSLQTGKSRGARSAPVPQRSTWSWSRRTSPLSATPWSSGRHDEPHLRGARAAGTSRADSPSRPPGDSCSAGRAARPVCSSPSSDCKLGLPEAPGPDAAPEPEGQTDGTAVDRRQTDGRHGSALPSKGKNT